MAKPPILGPAHFAALAERAAAALAPLGQWAGRCHEASLFLVRARLFEGARVARGTCRGVAAQHSWVVLGDPYDPAVVIVDPTLWSYDESIHGVWAGRSDGRHQPHGGTGTIWQWGRPAPARGPVVALTPGQPLSHSAQAFLAMLGPLDAAGWRALAHAPVRGWPAGEILGAMADTPALRGLVPIDLLGMLTERNPHGLYLP